MMQEEIRKILLRYRLSHIEPIVDDLNTLFMYTLEELLVKYTKELTDEKTK